ncbi:MAG: hypothetical protein LBV51_03800 [Acholeplasmatales bacterium]|jgi:hypothetical protein|nr:hypothetical protein [Acholeplasmatales bacterium]
MKSILDVKSPNLKNESVIKLLSLYENRGKEFYYETIFKKDQKSFIASTIKDDLFYYCRYFELDLTDNKIKLLTKSDLIPKNNTETIFLNLKKILYRIQNSADTYELYASDILTLNKLLNANDSSIAFNTREISDEGLLKKNESMVYELENLLSEYKKLITSKNYENIYIVSKLIVDFCNDGYFNKGINNTSLIILYIVLIKHFKSLRYVSLFSILYELKDIFNNSLAQSKYFYSINVSDTLFLYEILLDIVYKSYLKLSSMAKEYDPNIKQKKTDNIEATIDNLPNMFTKEQIRKEHPNISDITIDRTLKRLKDELKIKPIGKGRSSLWQKTNHNSSPHLTLFSDF